MSFKGQKPLFSVSTGGIMGLQEWIQEYIMAHLGKQTRTDKHWDKQAICEGRILQVWKPGDSKHHRPRSSGLELIITDGDLRIRCLINPSVFVHLDDQQFTKFKVLNLKRIELKISHSFREVYLLVMDCSFSAGLQMMNPDLKTDKQRKTDYSSTVMSRVCIQDAIQKYRTSLSFKFHPKPGDEDQGMDSELQIPDTLNSAQYSIGFDDEIYDYRNEQDPGPLELIRDFKPFEAEEDGIQSLCIEEPSPHQINEEEQETKEEGEGDEVMNSMNKNTNTVSDKEEMEEDEEKDIIENVSTKGNKEGDAMNDNGIASRPMFIGNESDWVHCLYPNLKDIPKALKSKIAEIEKPEHIPSRPPRKRKHPPAVLQEYQSPSKRQRVEPSNTTTNTNKTDEDKDASSGDYSQSSLNSADWEEIDRRTAQYQAQKQREKEKEGGSGFEFDKPTWTLTERIRNKQNNHNGTTLTMNESILSVQESVVSDSGHVNDSILSQKSRLEVMMEKESADGMELDDTRDTMNVNRSRKNQGVDHESKATEPPLDPLFLGLITKSDLERMHRYMISNSVANKLKQRSCSS